MVKDTLLETIIDEIGSAYSLIKHLGGGEFSNVYLVRHKETGEERALKILDYHYLLQRLKKQHLPDMRTKFEEIKNRFISEARLYKKIFHPNIVDIYDTGTLTDPIEGIEIPFFVMSYVKGSTLAEIIRKQAPLPVDRVVQIATNVLEALEAMHRSKIIHRDIKASNIMIRDSSGEAVIIDFGIAKDIVGGTRLTTTGALLGSPAYMAPEQFLDSSNVGPGLDIYSFGVVLFEMLTGDPPFKGNNFIEVMNAHRKQQVPPVSSINPTLPPGTDLVLARAMAKDPNHRFHTARDFLNSVKQIKAVKPHEHFARHGFQVLAAIVIAVVALFVVKSMLVEKPGENESQVEQTQPVNKQPHQKRKPRIATKVQREYRELKQFLAGNAPQTEKLEKCRQFLDNYSKTAVNRQDLDIIQQIEQTRDGLLKETTAHSKFQDILNSTEKYIDTNDFNNAEKQINQLIKLESAKHPRIKELTKKLEDKKQQYEKVNGATRFNELKNSITLADFLQFKKQYPDSVYLEELKRALMKSDGTLPPEKYWGQPLKKNNKGFYELTFDETFNNHHMVYIPSRHFWIDKYEVSNSQYRRYLKAQKLPVPEKSENQFIHEGDNYPVVLQYSEAEKYCRAYNFRLPERDEWEYAAGKGIFTYPWGNDAPDKDHICRANFDTLDEKGEQDGFNGTAPVDSFEKYTSPFGVQNMAGNVWEWVRGSILKGGSFFSTTEDLAVRKNRGGRSNDREGFRCVKVEKIGGIE